VSNPDTITHPSTETTNWAQHRLTLLIETNTLPLFIVYDIVHRANGFLEVYAAFVQMIHFCPALYNYVVNEMKKNVILVLNKVDVAPVELVTAWKSYFQEKYPLLWIVCFTSRPRDMCAAGSDPGCGQYGCLCWSRHFMLTMSIVESIM